jgi:hypothetical protein
MSLKTLVNNTLRNFGFQFTKITSVENNDRIIAEHENVLTMLKSQDQLIVGYMQQISLLTSQQKPSTARKVVIKDSRQDSSSDLRMRAMKNNGFSPSTFIDCYDCDGKWAKKVSEIFEGIQVTLLEPNKVYLDWLHSDITEFSDDTKILNIYLCETEGQIPQSEISEETLNSYSAKDMLVPKKKLDSVLHEEGIVPEFLRFGSRAIRSGVLEGATKSLNNAEVCVLSYNIDNPRMLISLFSDLLRKLDYVFYDIWSLDYREYDNRLNTCDFVFVKSHSQLLINPD